MKYMMDIQIINEHIQASFITAVVYLHVAYDNPLCVDQIYDYFNFYPYSLFYVFKSLFYVVKSLFYFNRSSLVFFNSSFYFFKSFNYSVNYYIYVFNLFSESSVICSIYFQYFFIFSFFFYISYFCYIYYIKLSFIKLQNF